MVSFKEGPPEELAAIYREIIKRGQGGKKVGCLQQSWMGLPCDTAARLGMGCWCWGMSVLDILKLVWSWTPASCCVFLLQEAVPWSCLLCAVVSWQGNACPWLADTRCALLVWKKAKRKTVKAGP